MVTSLNTFTRVIKSVFTAKPYCKNELSPITHNGCGAANNALYNISTHKENLVAITKTILDYSDKGEIDIARRVFDQMGHRDSVTWNVMIKGYIHNNRVRDARDLFDEMPEKNSFSYGSIIAGYARDKKTHVALKLFLTMPCRDVLSSTAVITALCGDTYVEDAWRLFEEMPEKNSVSWSTIISGFQQNGLSSKSLIVFKKMLSLGIEPTSHSFTSALAACADLAMLSVSEQFYSQIAKRGLEANTHVGNSCVSMFVKSGCFENVRRVFVNLSERNIVTWNSMIVGYGQYGFGIEAITLFNKMIEARFVPDRISFLGVLQGCAHCGLIKEGEKYFQSMKMDYGISPGPEHCASMVDIYARGGFLKEAYDTIRYMPFEPSPVFWRILLNGCSITNDTELSFRIAEEILKLEPRNSHVFSCFVSRLKLRKKQM